MSESATMVCVPPQWVKEVWPHCSGLVSQGLSVAGETTLHDARSRLDAGCWQLWLIFDCGSARVLAAVCTSIAARYVCVVACGGVEMDRWRNVLKRTLRHFAQAEGCAAVRFKGRRGWSRVFPECRAVGNGIYEGAVA